MSAYNYYDYYTINWTEANDILDKGDYKSVDLLFEIVLKPKSKGEQTLVISYIGCHDYLRNYLFLLYPTVMKAKYIIDTIDSWPVMMEMIQKGYPYWGNDESLKAVSAICYGR